MTNLKVQVVLGNGFIPIMDALVTIKNEYITYSTPTAFDGSVYFTSLPTNKKDDNGYLYDDYTLLVEKKDFATVETIIRLCNEQDAICKIVLNRKDERLRYVAAMQEIDNVMEQDMLHEDNLVAFAPPYIPPTITVHLGSPNTSAENLTLPFLDYIKNVACSEVYPSWPKEALYANIHAIVSLTLNRIYTGWYRVQGYNFDITSSTQYDQKFIKNRVIFDSISECVEDAFTTYIQKGNAIEPFFSSYCDGKQVTCSGMKQWGSYDLAMQGYNALEILKYYYGENIELKNAAVSQANVSIYPGTPLSLGDQGKDVYQMQYYLNRIAIDYPNIIKIYPANGIFTYRMRESVKQFQEQFNLTVDGIIGKATWYSIAYIFYSVTRLAQIESEGLKQGSTLIQYPGAPLRKGSRGENVFKLQYLLFVLSYFNQQLLPVDVDSYFGNNTYDAVINFQNYYGLTSDGIVGKKTWDAIVGMYNDIASLIPTFTHTVPYPGSPLKEGSRGEYVEILQSYLNYISAFYSSIHLIEVDKTFGPETKKNVQAFQKLFSLPVTGIVNEKTWNTIMNTYRLISSVILYPNIELKRGSTSIFVSYLQLYLNDIASVDSSLPLLVVDGIYGTQTENSVKKFQQKHDLTPTGSVDSITWNTILKVYLEDVRYLATLDTMLLQDIQPAYLYR